MEVCNPTETSRIIAKALGFSEADLKHMQSLTLHFNGHDIPTVTVVYFVKDENAKQLAKKLTNYELQPK